VCSNSSVVCVDWCIGEYEIGVRNILHTVVSSAWLCTCVLLCLLAVTYLPCSFTAVFVKLQSISSGKAKFVVILGTWVLFAIDFFVYLYVSFYLSFFLSLFFCQQDYQKTTGLICKKFSGKVRSDHGTTWLHFWSIPRNHAMSRCTTRGRGFLCFSTTACLLIFLALSMTNLPGFLRHHMTFLA